MLVAVVPLHWNAADGVAGVLVVGRVAVAADNFPDLCLFLFLGAVGKGEQLRRRAARASSFAELCVHAALGVHKMPSSQKKDGSPVMKSLASGLKCNVCRVHRLVIAGVAAAAPLTGV